MTAALAFPDEYQIEIDEASHTYYVTTQHYTRRRFDHVTGMLAAMGMSRSFDQVDRATLQDAAWRGTRVHQAALFLDEPEGLDWTCLEQHEVPYVQSWDSWKYDTGFRAIELELPLANLAYEIAGRVDRIGELRDGDPAIVDLKTGEVDEATALQTAGYGFMRDPGKIFHRFAVRLRPDGRPLVKEFPIEEYMQDVQVFLSAVSAFKWRKKHRR